MIIKRPNSPYWMTYFSVDGKMVRRSTKRINKREAYEVATAMRREMLDRVQLGHKEDVPLLAAVDRYLETMAESNDLRNLQTRKLKLFGLGHWDHVFHFSPTKMLSSLATSDVARLREARRREGLAPSSVNLELKLLQRTYNLSRTEWEYDVRPDVVFTMLKTKSRERFLNDDEEALLLARVHNDPLIYALVLFLLDTGVRLQEALDLTWGRVNLDESRVTVYRSKTDSRTRLGLTDRLVAALRPLEGPDRIPVFPHMSRRVRNLRSVLSEVAPGATIHDLRHTFASRLVGEGATLYQVSALLGHKSLQMSQRYAHLEVNRVAEEAAERLNRRQKE